MSVSLQQDAPITDYYRVLGRKFLSSTEAGLRTVPMAEFANAVRALDAVRHRGNRVYALGNGGSASTASHLVCDLVKTAQQASAPPLRAFALADNNAVLTAYSNDISFSDAFSEQLHANAEPADVVVVISASGNSPNVLQALRAARQLGLASIGMLGCGGGAAADLVDIPLVIDSHDFGVIETAHVGIVHALTAVLRQPAPSPSVPSRTGGR
jgi:D-sedoheptulose 7-phosphate isomerase